MCLFPDRALVPASLANASYFSWRSASLIRRPSPNNPCSLTLIIDVRVFVFESDLNGRTHSNTSHCKSLDGSCVRRRDAIGSPSIQEVPLSLGLLFVVKYSE